MKKWLRILVDGAARLVGHGTEDAEKGPPVGTTEEATAATSPEGSPVVTRHEDGLFKSGMVPHPKITPSGPDYNWGCEWGYWIDLRVQNLAYRKEAGVIWTDDGWKTSHVGYARYKGDLGGGYERWGLDLTGWSSAGRPPVIEYAAFATMNGRTWYGKGAGGKNYTLRP